MGQDAGAQAATGLPPTRKGKATREKLLAAAAVAFGQHGYNAVRITDIVAEAGISHGLFYRHFADKDAILLALLDQLNEELRRTTARTVGEADSLSLERLEARNIQFFRDYRRDRLLLRVAREAAAQQEHSDFRRVWLQMRDRFVARTERWLERLVTSGAVGLGTDTRLTASYYHLTRNDMPDEGVRPIGALSYMALKRLDDFGYGAGLWRGVLRERTLQPLRPDIK